MKSRDTLLVLAALAACNGPGENKDTNGNTDETGAPPASVETVWVNEVMAQNQSTLQDEAGFFPDWVELWNPNDEAVDLSGWWLTDDIDDPFNWQFPDGVVIEPGAYLIVFCDDDPIEGELHASFHLSGLNGEDVALFGPNVLDNPLVDSVEDMAIQTPDISFARMPDGGPTWEFDSSATPAAPNN